MFVAGKIYSFDRTNAIVYLLIKLYSATFLTLENPVPGSFNRVAHPNISYSGKYHWYPQQDDTVILHDELSSRGDNGIWLDSDDVLHSYSDQYSSEDGMLTSQISFISPGGNTIWFDTDNEATTYSIYQYNESKLLDTYIQYSTGADTKPLTTNH